MLQKEAKSLRPIYKEMDARLRDLIFTPLKMQFHRDNNLPENRAKRPYKKLFRFKPSRSKADISEDITDMMSGYLESIAESYKDHKQIDNITASNILYERFALQSKRAFKLSNEDIESLFTKYNTGKIQNAKDKESVLSSLIPPHLVDWASIPLTDDKQVQTYVKTLSQSAARLASNEYSLRHAVKAQQSAIELALDSQADLDSLGWSELKEKEEEYRELYAQKLLERKNAEKKPKNPKKSLTEFEKAGLAQYKKQKQYIDAVKEFESGSKEISDHMSMDEHNEHMDYLEGKIALTKPTPSEEKLCAEFIHHITDNKKFNKRFNRQIRKGRLVPPNLDSNNQEMQWHKQTNSEVSKYSYKTFGIKRIFSAIKKLGGVNNQISTHGMEKELPEKEKMTVRELGAIGKFTDNKEVMSVLDSVSHHHGELARISEENRNASKESTDFFDRVDAVSNDAFKSGDIMVTPVKRMAQYTGRKAKGLENKLRNWITSYGHASIATKEHGQLSHSHIDHQYSRDAMSSTDAFLTDAFRVRPGKLMSKQNKIILAEATKMNGPELEEYLEDEYQSIAENMHNDMQVISEEDAHLGKARIFNTEANLRKVGKSSFIPGAKKSKEKVKKWVDRVSDTANKTDVKTAIASDADGQMVCSSFAIKTTILALHELEGQLQGAMKQHNLADKIPEKGFMKIPVKKRANLAMLNPSNVIAQLRRFDAIKQVKLGINAIKGR